jgi:hypothetical protein
MSQRVIIGLHSAADVTPGLRDGLRALGAQQVGDPAPAMPDVIVVTLAAGEGLEAFMQGARGLPGVRYVEPDTMRFTS